MGYMYILPQLKTIMLLIFNFTSRYSLFGIINSKFSTLFTILSIIPHHYLLSLPAQSCPISKVGLNTIYTLMISKYLFPSLTSPGTPTQQIQLTIWYLTCLKWNSWEHPPRLLPTWSRQLRISSGQKPSISGFQQVNFDPQGTKRLKAFFWLS